MPRQAVGRNQFNIMPTVIEYLKLDREELLEERAKIDSALLIQEEQSKLLDEMRKEEPRCGNCIHYEGVVKDGDCVTYGRCIVSKLLGSEQYVCCNGICPEFVERRGEMTIHERRSGQ